MSRVKRGVTAHRRHKKILSLTQGHRGQRHRLIKRATESMLHALRYNYVDRRDRKSDFRELWIMRINAAARLHGLSYSRMIHGLSLAGIDLDRKALADLAVTRPDAFETLVEQAKGAIASGVKAPPAAAPVARVKVDRAPAAPAAAAPAPAASGGSALGGIAGLSPAHAATLAADGVTTPQGLVAAVGTPAARKRLAAKLDVTAADLTGWANRAGLLSIEGVDGSTAELLAQAGVDTAKKLGARRADNLHAKLVDAGGAGAPALEAVESWVAAAKALAVSSADDE
jgi:large subunit ribosomal protein L20